MRAHAGDERFGSVAARLVVLSRCPRVCEPMHFSGIQMEKVTIPTSKTTIVSFLGRDMMRKKENDNKASQYVISIDKVLHKGDACCVDEELIIKKHAAVPVLKIQYPVAH